MGMLAIGVGGRREVTDGQPPASRSTRVGGRAWLAGQRRGAGGTGRYPETGERGGEPDGDPTAAAWADKAAVAVFTKNIVVAAAIAFLALLGAAFQDDKKRRLQPESWPFWEARTGYWPFAAILGGRARLSGFGMHALAGGLAVWLIATWAHIPLAGYAAGIWRWF